MAKSGRGLSALTWALIALATSLAGLVVVAVWAPYSWGWMLVLGVFVVPAAVLVVAALRWRRRHIRFQRRLAAWSGGKGDRP